MKSQLVTLLKSAVRNPQSAIRRALFPAVLLFCSLICLRAPDARPQVGAFAQGAGAANSREDRLKVFDQVWRAIFENYYDKRFRVVDWRSQREIFRPQVEAARNNAEVYRVLRQMIRRPCHPP